MIIRSPEPEVKILVDRDHIKTSFEEWARPGHFSRTIAKGPETTTWIWNLHADAHDFDSHTSDLEEISRKVFSAHFGQLSIIFLWLSGMYFHGARFSNYEAWLSDPTHIRPSAQVVWPIVGQEILNGDVGGGFRGIQITSGFFQIWRASGITSELQLYCTAIGGLVFAALMLFAGWFHYHKAAPKLAWFQDVESMLNHHLAGLLGLGSLSWAGHQVHVSLPINQFLNAGVDPKEIPLPHEFILNRDLLAQLYPSFAEGATPFFTLNWSKYSDFLTFRGGLDPVTGGLWLTDTAHHHLAIAILFLIAGHMYRTNWGIGHGLKDILEAHKGPFTGQGHKGLYEILTTSWHAQLSLNLAMLGSLTIIVAHHMYAMPPYPYLATDYGTQLSLFTHHMWIGGFLIVGAAAHAAIFMAFTVLIQNTHALAPSATAPGATASTSLTWGGGDLVAVGGKVALLPIPLGTADFLVHHIHAFTIHVTVLILLKGVLFARSSRLIPDKANLGFRFPCDGPGRGGTCQVSAWDHVFLGLFWMYNAISVVIFHFSWKMQSDVWGSISDQGVVTHITGGNFAQSSITINGWLRDFLWGTGILGFCQGLAQDLTTRCIWFGIATAHDFESHDDITEEPWQGNFESWVQDPLHVRPIAHAIWDPYFGQPAVEAFTRGGALGPVNITYYESRLNHHLSGLFGVSSLAWTGHLVHVAIPASRGEYVRWNNFLDVLPHPQGLGPLFTAIAFIFLIAGHMYRTNFGIGHSMKDLLDAHIPPGGRLGRGHKGLYDTINNSLHFQLGLALASLGVITSLVAQHMYSLPAYAFIAQDFTTQAALYTHHQYIAGFIMTGAFAHGAIFFIRDYNPEQNEDKYWQTLGLYVHKEACFFGTPEKQILIEPIFAQWIQSAHGKTSYGFDILLSSTNGPAFNAGRSIWLPGWLNAINENSNSLFLTIGPGDFLVHHAIALGLHTTTLILVKGALDARGSKLMPDKKDFGYSFPCDGPGRGGTCDISAWDAFYLAVFWMLNTIGWVTFYWHWKHITLWQGNVSQFNESSTYLMGWLRDYYMVNLQQLING
ncbi:photosystem I P700 apoprotein A1 [Tanacetum coccineum]